tara:strand:- start:113 stop:1132 length:1020 start_codon:yes stop_codon:yes gene_type:complete
MESFTEIDPENAPHSHRNRGGHGEKFDQWEREISGQTGRAHSAKGVHFQFPSDLGQGKGDLFHWMMITAKEVVGGFENTKTAQFGNPSGSVALPIPPGIQATYTQNWNQMDVPVVRGAIARAAGEGSRIWPGANRSLHAFTQQLGVQVSDSPIGGNAGDTGPDPLEATESLSALLKGTGMADVMQFETGARVLNQVMLSYGGPSFREFTYAFSLKPNNEDDSAEIDSLIKWLKFKSAPGQNVGKFIRVFRLPSVFKIQFFSGSEENERIPKIGHCVLKNIGAQYGGDIFRTFDRDSTGHYSPVQINLSLAFQEMEFLDRSSFLESSDQYKNPFPNPGDF